VSHSLDIQSQKSPLSLASRATGFLHTFHSRARNWTLPTLEFIKISVYSFYKWMMKKTHNSAPCCALALLNTKSHKNRLFWSALAFAPSQTLSLICQRIFIQHFTHRKLCLYLVPQSKQVMWRQRGWSECVCDVFYIWT
jgi:hypothetical protein